MVGGGLLAALAATAVAAASLGPGLVPPRSACRPRPYLHVSMSTSAQFGAEAMAVEAGARAIVVGVDIKQHKYKTREAAWSVTDSLDELERLCETAGLEVVGRESQVMQHPSPSTFVGPGKVAEVVALAAAEGARVVVIDDELSPAQARNLQAAFAEGMGGPALVLDRTQLILQIFAQRARTREAKLQVEAAQLRYMLPRLTSFLTTGAGMDARGGSGGGGGGAALRGAGETQLEMDKRLFRKQISRIEAEMADVQLQRERWRAKRSKRDRLPVVAIVGYTNAGKSTLLNKLCGSDEVYADDLLFATLDPTSRLVRLPSGGREALLSDTVGFIQNLPTRLVQSFRATLDELHDASIVLHVVDAASPRARQQVWSVQDIIRDLGEAETPQILVLNKADTAGIGVALEAELEREGSLASVAVAPGALAGAELGRLPDGSPLAEDWLSVHPDVHPRCAVVTSAKTGAGLDELLETIEALLLDLSVLVECVVPYAAGDLLAEIHRDGTIAEEDYRETGTYVRAHVPRSLCNRLAKYAVE